MQHSFKGMDGQKTQTLPSMPSLPSLPPMPKEEKEPRPYLKSDRSLMKAPSKGSPGSRKNKTPFERKNSNNNKALAQNYVTPVQGNMTPEKGKLSPMQTDVMKNMQARSLSEHIERAEGIYQRGNAAKDKNDAPFLIVSSSYDNCMCITFSNYLLHLVICCSICITQIRVGFKSVYNSLLLLINPLSQ